MVLFQIRLQEKETHLDQINLELIAVQQEKEGLSLKIEESTKNSEQNSQAFNDLQKAFEDSKIQAQFKFDEITALRLAQEVTLQLCMKEKNDLEIVRAEKEVRIFVVHYYNHP